MPFDASEKPKPVPYTYRTLYLPVALKEEVDRLASENHSSFNKMVIRMIEYCLNDMKEPET